MTSIPRHPLDTEPYQILQGSPDLAEAGRELLRQALTEARVDLGAHDEKIAHWVGGIEAPIAVTVASWIVRAFEAGHRAAVETQLDKTGHAIAQIQGGGR